MLKVGGIYVSPFEVEGALCTHPDVLEAAVVGWPDEEELIKPKAFVVLKTRGQGCDDSGGRVAGSVQGEARALQISALDRVPQRAAEDCDRQDPAIQAKSGKQRGNAGKLTRLTASLPDVCGWLTAALICIIAHEL